MPDEVKEAVGLAKPFIIVGVFCAILIVIAGISVMILGKDNPVEVEAEKVVEAEIAPK